MPHSVSYFLLLPFLQGKASPEHAEASLYAPGALGIDRQIGSASLPFAFALPDSNEAMAVPVMAMGKRESLGMLNVVSSSTREKCSLCLLGFVCFLC